MTDIRHRVFVSYHHEDQEEVDNFLSTFGNERNVFTHRAVGTMSDDIINSDNTEYVMSQIRKKYLKDSTVTIVLIGKCTWARRYVDWEIKTSLRRGSFTPNGLIGILLPSMNNTATPPQRLKENLLGDDANEGYARWYTYPKRKDSLKNWIEDAFQARSTRPDLIANSASMFKYNRSC
ncbi:TIR domain-containing protein [Salisediminibacterium beveridgei]|uniref:TIR domain-containing protein n=1 Tax=Salisediminibacterium beveridgei TaxID=632773 RepID=UPI000847F56C|nr:TIR domain-containing protein [Salisediminibacterium beveridgei]